MGNILYNSHEDVIRMMERMILHSDINHCYAQIEEMKYPDLRYVPMAVGGHEEDRHGIILAKNDLAKTYGLKTGETLYSAKQKCPGLLILPPNYGEYMNVTDKVKNIYQCYSDRVESYGLDEAWIDISKSTELFGSGYTIACMIQERIKRELGLTVSIGISFNKIFAKMASDMNKCSGLIEVTKENYQTLIWNLPVEDLFYVGKATKRKLNQYGVQTIGDLASLPIGWMKDHFGKIGELLWWFSNGKDVSDVMLQNYQDPMKSIGNAITAPRDIRTFHDAKVIYYVLVESVASRMRDAELYGNVIQITLRDCDLVWFTRQRKISSFTNLASDIMPVVLSLLNENHNFKKPLRTIGVSVSGLINEHNHTQLNLFKSEEEQFKQRSLEDVVDNIRYKFGFDKIKRCVCLTEQDISDFNPKADHVIHPISFF